MDYPHENSYTHSRYKHSDSSNLNQTLTPSLKTPRPNPDVFNESSLLLSKKCCASTPSSKIIPPTPQSKSVQRWLHKSRHSRMTKFDIDYEHVKKIGSGHFADVYSAKSLANMQYYTIKKSRFPFQGRADRQRKLQEVRNHELLPPHENCVKYIKSWEEDGLLYIQTELCKTSLNEIIESAEDNKLPENVVWTYLVDLLLAVKHLHSHDLIHLDIKPENIFISFDNIAKLGDFGLMYDLKKGAMTLAKSADIFSLGATIFKISTGIDLPMGCDCKIDESYYNDLSNDLIRLIKLMTNVDPNKRPTVDKLLNMKINSPSIPGKKIMVRSYKKRLNQSSGNQANKIQANKNQSRIDDYYTHKVRSPIIRTRSKTPKNISEDDVVKHYIAANSDPKYIHSRQDPEKKKGLCVFSLDAIKPGQFVCEYAGDLITKEESIRRISEYEEKNLGSYIFDLKWRGKILCLDATLPSGRLGRLINHSRKKPNCKAELYTFEDQPHLIIRAIKDIKENEEILYDYGERDEATIKANPWLANT